MIILSIIFAFLFVGVSPAVEEKESPQKDEIKVYIFLHETCRISQFYTPTLKALHQEYGSESIVFEGIFPNPNTTTEAIEAFQEKYELPFDMVVDQNQTITKELGATVTPEAIVYNVSKAEVLYKGRIDDSYFRVGKRRQVTTTSELKDVLEALENGDSVRVESKEAIGCFIKILE